MAVPIATCGVVTFRRTLKLLSFFCSPVHAFAGGCASVAAATRSVCVAGGRCGPVYAAPVPACTDRLEACEEGTAVQGIGREGGGVRERYLKGHADRRRSPHWTADCRIWRPCCRRPCRGAMWETITVLRPLIRRRYANVVSPVCVVCGLWLWYMVVVV